jgi:hypothetical protein
VGVNVTLSIDDDLVEKVRRIAVERGTTLKAMICEYLQTIVAEDAASDRQRGDGEALETTFQDLEFRVGERTWKREGLYERHPGIRI